MSEEKTIVKCRVGTHLYGTNRPESDDDFAGVRLHSLEQTLGLQNPPNEASENVKLSDGPRNSVGDVDCKFFYLPRFIQLAAQGQPGQLEMLFAPDEMILLKTDEWLYIKENIDLFKSRKGISPFIGFALSQAHKAVIKGETLNLIRDLRRVLTKKSSAELNMTLESFFTGYDDHTYEIENGPRVKKAISDDGTEVIQIAGRKYNLGISGKKFLNSITAMEENYGTRVRAAAEQKYDYKSLGHAVRLLSQAEEFLTTGKITLPRPDAEFVKSILRGTCDPETDWLDYISQKIDYLKQVVEPSSPLPSEPDWKKLNQLCIEIRRKHLF